MPTKETGHTTHKAPEHKHHRAEDTKPQHKAAAPDETETVTHGTNDNPPELEQTLKETLQQYDFKDVGYVQQSDRNSFLRLKQFDSEVTIDGKTYPCRILVQFQMAREQVEEAAA